VNEAASVIGTMILRDETIIALLPGAWFEGAP
jgi:hypothetical protein